MGQKTPTARPKDDATGSLSATLNDMAVRAFLGTASLLPYETRVRALGAFSARILAPTSRFGRRIDENLSFVFPQMSAAERERIGRASADGLGRLAIEIFSWRDLKARMAPVDPVGPGVAALAQAHKDKRPVLLMTGHYGNFVAPCPSLIARGYPVGGLYRPLSNEAFNRRYVAAMEALGGPTFATTARGMKNLLGYLRKGGMVLVLNDLYIGTGTEMPFLGQPAMTSLAPAEIAARVDALMIPVWGTRQADGLSFTVDVDAPLPMGDPAETIRAYNAAVEARIRAHPEQWFWVHRRWKKKWNKGKGMQGDLHPAQLPSRRSRL
ncbi:MAG: lauroyl acyltransferase [Pseudomonadota bacterium]